MAARRIRLARFKFASCRRFRSRNSSKSTPERATTALLLATRTGQAVAEPCWCSGAMPVLPPRGPLPPIPQPPTVTKPVLPDVVSVLNSPPVKDTRSAGRLGLGAGSKNGRLKARFPQPPPFDSVSDTNPLVQSAISAQNAATVKPDPTEMDAALAAQMVIKDMERKRQVQDQLDQIKKRINSMIEATEQPADLTGIREEWEDNDEDWDRLREKNEGRVSDFLIEVDALQLRRRDVLNGLLHWTNSHNNAELESELRDDDDDGKKVDRWANEMLKSGGTLADIHEKIVRNVMDQLSDLLRQSIAKQARGWVLAESAAASRTCARAPHAMRRIDGFGRSHSSPRHGAHPARTLRACSRAARSHMAASQCTDKCGHAAGRRRRVSRRRRRRGCALRLTTCRRRLHR